MMVKEMMMVRICTVEAVSAEEKALGVEQMRQGVFMLCVGL